MLNTDFIVRFSVLPMRACENLTTEQARRSLRSFLEISSKARPQGQSASDALFDLIGSETDGRRRSSLLRIRRSLFNGRVPATSDIAACRSFLPEGVVHAIELLIERNAAFDLLRAAMDEATDRARSTLREVIETPRMRAGILASSESLFLNLSRYRASNGKVSGRELQIERGLLRYVTRASMKATPFSAFCTIIQGMHVASQGGEQPYGQRLASESPTSFCLVRPNKAFFGHLWEGMKADDAIRQWLWIELNPSTTLEDERYRFLATQLGREIFRRVEANETLDVVVRLLRESDRCRLRDVVSSLQELPDIDASPEEAASYLDGLVRIGMVRFQSPVRTGEGEWPKYLRAFLADVPGTVAAALKSFCEDVSQHAQRYALADATERRQILQSFNTGAQHALEALKRPTPADASVAMYDDWGADTILEITRTTAYDASAERLKKFVSLVLPLASPWPEVATIRAVADRMYGNAWDPVDLLHFYEDYHRDHYRDHLARTQEPSRKQIAKGEAPYNTINPLNLATIDRIIAARMEWTKRCQLAWASNPTAEEVNISEEDVPRTHDWPGAPRTGTSVSLFTQLLATAQDGSTRFVTKAGSVHLGYGKYFSRFLDLCSEDLRESLLDHNSTLSSALLAEIGGDENFNANLHPPLVPYTISYPSVDGEDSDHTLRCDELVVARDPESTIGVILVHRPTGKRVIPLDLGFLTSRRRPALFQLLSQFAPIRSFGVHLPTSYESTGSAQASSTTVYRPRFVFENTVVLSRRRWSVGNEHYPLRELGEGSAEYLVRVNEWRAAEGIPERVYVHIQLKAGTSAPNPVTSQNRSAKSDADQLATEIADADGGEDAVDDVANDWKTEETRSTAESGPQSSKVTPQDARPSASTKRVDRKRMPVDPRKPQFVDFTSPLLVDLFSRLPGEAKTFTVHMEECYPDSSHLPMMAGEQHAMEYVMQLEW